MTRSGLIAAAFALAAIVLVLIVGQDMRNAGFIIRAYVTTAVILALYTWSLSRRLRRAEEQKQAREGGAQ